MAPLFLNSLKKVRLPPAPGLQEMPAHPTLSAQGLDRGLCTSLPLPLSPGPSSKALAFEKPWCLRIWKRDLEEQWEQPAGRACGLWRSASEEPGLLPGTREVPGKSPHPPGSSPCLPQLPPTTGPCPGGPGELYLKRTGVWCRPHLVPVSQHLLPETLFLSPFTPRVGFLEGKPHSPPASRTGGLGSARPSARPQCSSGKQAQSGERIWPVTGRIRGRVANTPDTGVLPASPHTAPTASSGWDYVLLRFIYLFI